jgi:hypothetical protein
MGDFSGLKRCNDFDVFNDGLTLEALNDQYIHTMSMLKGRKPQINSIYEIGCP